MSNSPLAFVPCRVLWRVPGVDQRNKSVGSTAPTMPVPALASRSAETALWREKLADKKSKKSYLLKHIWSILSTFIFNCSCLVDSWCPIIINLGRIGGTKLYSRISIIKHPYITECIALVLKENRPENLKAPEINLKQELFFQHDAEVFNLVRRYRGFMERKPAIAIYINNLVSILDEYYNVYY